MPEREAGGRSCMESGRLRRGDACLQGTPCSLRLRGSGVALCLDGLDRTLTAANQVSGEYVVGILFVVAALLWAPAAQERHIVCVGRNVAGRKWQERELARSGRRFHALLNAPNILAGVLRPDGYRLSRTRRDWSAWMGPSR
mgnify:FL=1